MTYSPSDRDRKTSKRPMPVHGLSMKRLLNERAAKAQAVAADEADHRRMHLLTGTLECSGPRCPLWGLDCGADYCVDPGNCRKHDKETR